MAMMVNGLNFFSHTFSPHKQLLPSEVSFRTLFFILAYFGDRLCRHSILRAAHTEFMTIEIFNSRCA